LGMVSAQGITSRTAVPSPNAHCHCGSQNPPAISRECERQNRPAARDRAGSLRHRYRAELVRQQLDRTRSPRLGERASQGRGRDASAGGSNQRAIVFRSVFRRFRRLTPRPIAVEVGVSRTHSVQSAGPARCQTADRLKTQPSMPRARDPPATRCPKACVVCLLRRAHQPQPRVQLDEAA